MKSVMMKAWEIAREAAGKFGGRAAEYIAEALRIAWADAREPRTVTDRIEELQAMGFKRWQKNGMDRLYINATVLGLDYYCYKTGNIRSASFGGHEISNSEGYRMLAAKTYIDVKTQTVHSTNRTLGQAAAELAGLAFAG